MSNFETYIKSYKQLKHFKAVVRTDEEIKRDFSTNKYTIGKEFLNFLHGYEQLWKDEEYITNYLITPMKNDTMNFNYYYNPRSEHEALFLNFTQSHFIDLMWRMANGHNIITTLKGDTGSGKSTFAINDLYIVNKFVNEVLGKSRSFSTDNICFSRSEVVDLVPDLRSHESVLLDEDNEQILGVGSFANWAQVNRQEKTLRSLSKNFYNCSPDLRKHNEHYILKSMGINDMYKVNKCIFRERKGTWQGFYLNQMSDDKEFMKLYDEYLGKKKEFQEGLEERRGDDKRLQRMLNMSVELIKKHDLTYDVRSAFDSIINAEYKVSTQDCKEIKKLMKLLLDYRVNIFPEYKAEVSEYVGSEED